MLTENLGGALARSEDRRSIGVSIVWCSMMKHEREWRIGKLLEGKLAEFDDWGIVNLGWAWKFDKIEQIERGFERKLALFDAWLLGILKDKIGGEKNIGNLDDWG